MSMFPPSATANMAWLSLSTLRPTLLVSFAIPTAVNVAKTDGPLVQDAPLKLVLTETTTRTSKNSATRSMVYVELGKYGWEVE